MAVSVNVPMSFNQMTAGLDQDACPCVYVVVLNWNNYGDTRNCLESLNRSTYPNLKIIVVDNASADGSGQRLQQEFERPQFLFNPENFGFARGCNVGMAAALRQQDCDYVLLLNNDAVVEQGFLEKAVAFAETHPRVGVVGGKILSSVEPAIIAYAGGYVDRVRAGCIVRGSGVADKGQFDKTKETGFIIGALMLIKRQVLVEVGLLSEKYFFGVEDLDYSLRVRQAGYKLYYVPDFRIHHKGAASHADFDPRFVYIGYRSRLMFQQDHLPRVLFALWKPAFILFARYIERYRALRLWRKRLAATGNGQRQAIDERGIDLAFRKAIKDHGKNSLCESTLAVVDEYLKAQKIKRDSSGGVK
jgi:GT2 family glycosyltransferase